MSTCARCGEPYSICAVSADPEATHLEQLKCARRELANLRSLLRSVTGNLEEAHQSLDGADRNQWEAQMLIASVLEALS